MLRRTFVRLATCAALSLPLLAQNPSSISGGADIDIEGFDVVSSGWAEFHGGCLGIQILSGTHSIQDGGSGTVASASVDDNPYGRTVTAATIYEHCYQARLELYGNQGTVCVEDSNTFRSATKCAPPRPCADTNSNGICDSNEAVTLDPDQCGDPCTSPVIINPANGSYTLSGADDPVAFDIDADGNLDRITWTSRGSLLAFLAIDRDRNATIDDGSELFGTATRLASGARAANGFAALAELDSNGDGLVNARDERWPDLLLWTDANHDGLSSPGEIRPVATSAIESLATSYRWTGRTDASGNVFRYHSVASVDGRKRPFYDVYFQIVR